CGFVFHHHRPDRRNAGALAAEGAVSVTEIQLGLRAADGSPRRARLAVPPAGNGPGLVLFPESGEADHDVGAIADLYAAEGYVVLCPYGTFGDTGFAVISAVVTEVVCRPECCTPFNSCMLGIGAG